MALTDLPANTGQMSIEIRLSGDPDPMFVTHHLLKDDAGLPTQADVDDLAEVIRDGIEVMMTEDYTLPTGRFLYRNNAAAGAPTNSFVLTTTSAAGNIVTEPVPPNVATLIKKATADFGRGSNGRMYVPGVPEVEVDKNGILAGAFVTNAQTAVDLWIAGFAAVGTGWTPVIVHHGPAAGGHAVEASGVITGYSVQNLVATQRRRLR